VIACLTNAADAREQAHRATLKSERIFYERMEQRWLGLAASAALVERVDLFVHTLQSTGLPHDKCARCHSVMSIEVIEAAGRQEIYTLRCRNCGGAERKTVMRYTLGGAERRGSGAATAAAAPPPAPAQSPIDAPRLG
jgi:hypothetical protein